MDLFFRVFSFEYFIPIIYGYVDAIDFNMSHEKSYRVLLISRRSRFQAGARFFRRGITEEGHVANEVETE